MFRLLSSLLGVGCVLSVMSRGQELPPGYQGVVQITNDTAFNHFPSINNRGQIAFSKRIDPYNENTSEIYLYDSGVVTRLTDDSVWDDYPDINDAGEIVWSREIGTGGTFEIVLWREGQLTRLTDDDLDDYSPQINNTEWIAWHKSTEQGCATADSVILLYDGKSVQTITSPGYADKSACLSDLGDVVWTRFNFCNQPWTSEIMLRLNAPGSDPVAVPLTGSQGEPRAPRINNRRLIAWLAQEPPNWNHHIMLWQNGVSWQLTDWGSGSRMNDRGDIVFDRWHDDSQSWQVWLYKAGEFWQITSDPFWNCDADINAYADVVWVAGPAFAANINLLKRFALGDLNCDGLINAFDIDPFVLALTDAATYASVYPTCDYILADINLDFQVNAFDIDPFVDLLTK